MPLRLRSKSLCCLFALSVAGLPTFAQTESQLAFSELQEQANSLVEDGRLVEALPLLNELIKRIDASKDDSIPLDLPIYLAGTAHIQSYIEQSNKADLNRALELYNRLEKDFPESEKLKDMVLRRIEVYRALGDGPAAIVEMEKILNNKYPTVVLDFPEQNKLLKDLTQVYYGQGKLVDGLPYFNRLLQTSRNQEDRAVAASARFEALFQQKKIDEALEMLPQLARESDVRYLPRLNVALLKASDVLVEEKRLNEAALTLNLIKTTDVMIEYHERKLREANKKIELRRAITQGTDEELGRLEQEVETLNNNLKQLRSLPTLRSELLVRRARNYTKTGRRYEAFWMFYDLLQSDPESKQTEFFHYATFSNALEIGKNDVALEVGEAYREKFPEGDFYADVSGGIANVLKNTGDEQGFLEIAINFLENQPQEAISRSLFAQWASYLIERGEYAELIRQAAEWYRKHENPIYEDGIFYWGGFAELQLSQFSDAVASFNRLLEKYPNSLYAEDTLLRKGAALYYLQDFDEALATLQRYVDEFPNGAAADQAYFFLGEIQYLAGDVTKALEYFETADRITTSQSVHDGAAFRIASLYEETGQHEKMAEHINAYMERFGDRGNITRAVFQLGRAYEQLLRPVDSLALFRETIEDFGPNSENRGVDILIEEYPERYEENKTLLTETVALFDRVRDDLEFREKFVTDRGFLFEQFYNNPEIDQSLYNRLRRDPIFTAALVDDVSPLDKFAQPYRDQLADFPAASPENYFRQQLAEARESGDRTYETRMLMGLYRSGVTEEPEQPFDLQFVETLSPRTMLYVADYERDKRTDFAADVWNSVLIYYPNDDATIVAFLRLASLDADNGEYGSALNYLEQVGERFPGSPKIPGIMLKQGEMLVELDRSADARDKYQYILRVAEWRGVLHARALYQIGQSYMADGEYDKAHGFFERTFLGYPHLVEWTSKAYLADAEALLAMNAREDAIKTLEEAVSELGDNEKAPQEVRDAIKTKLRNLRS